MMRGILSEIWLAIADSRDPKNSGLGSGKRKGLRLVWVYESQDSPHFQG